MSIERPGEFKITDRALEIANFKEGSRILDIGCGEGDTVNHLNEMGMKAEGIEMNLTKIVEAKKKFPGINVNYGDGEFLDEWPSYTFDGITMECVLSLINIPEESLNEAYCVLKKGGKLIITDLYERDPDPKQMAAVAMEAKRQSRLPHHEGDCENRGLKYVDFRFEGAFYKEPLIKMIEEVGFKVKAFEDFSIELDNYAAQIMLDGGKLEDACKGLKLEHNGQRRKIGYFMIVAEKPLLTR